MKPALFSFKTNLARSSTRKTPCYTQSTTTKRKCWGMSYASVAVRFRSVPSSRQLPYPVLSICAFSFPISKKCLARHTHPSLPYPSTFHRLPFLPSMHAQSRCLLPFPAFNRAPFPSRRASADSVEPSLCALDSAVHDRSDLAHHV